MIRWLFRLPGLAWSGYRRLLRESKWDDDQSAWGIEHDTPPRIRERRRRAWQRRQIAKGIRKGKL